MWLLWPTIWVQIIEDGPKTADGAFVPRMELFLISDGLVKRTLAD